MKKSIIALLVVVIIILAFLAFHARIKNGANSTPTTMSNGGFTWAVGQTTLGGSNIAAGTVSVSVAPLTNSSRETNRMLK